jgi:hypothetical protein
MPGIMLVTLCHRCWTWIEPKHERCVECGCPIDLHEPDPSEEHLRDIFAAPICGIAEVTLQRHANLPSLGMLTAFDNGLLFLPDLRQLPSGGMSAVEPATTLSRETTLPGFWNLLIRRTTDSIIDAPAGVRPELSLDSAVERFLDSPGALFIRREAVLRVFQRGTMLRIERKPGRTAVFRINSQLSQLKDVVARWRSSPFWQSVPMMING